jgi:hypothetical protein
MHPADSNRGPRGRSRREPAVHRSNETAAHVSACASDAAASRERCTTNDRRRRRVGKGRPCEDAIRTHPRQDRKYRRKQARPGARVGPLLLVRNERLEGNDRHARSHTRERASGDRPRCAAGLAVASGCLTVATRPQASMCGSRTIATNGAAVGHGRAEGRPGLFHGGGGAADRAELGSLRRGMQLAKAPTRRPLRGPRATAELQEQSRAMDC